LTDFELPATELVLVPAGRFLMGSPGGQGCDDEHPGHEVHLEAYYIGKYQVTNARFAEFVKKTGYRAQGDWQVFYFQGTENHPVVRVSWFDAEAYCRWAGLRLPTEAEWEKAARGTDGRKYPWGDAWDETRLNWYQGPGLPGMVKIYRERGMLPVGSFPGGASPWGCLDMAGNASEWCGDWYEKKYYRRSPASNPQGPERGRYRVLRGGAWYNNSPDFFRCSFRRKLYPLDWLGFSGFRVCRSADTHK
jgi:formylglycine-generating enzyme required for sulfatase activity